ncbi:MAG: hypothetical protein WKF71_00465 [Pyrinomonadaceae bacterium]
MSAAARRLRGEGHDGTLLFVQCVGHVTACQSRDIVGREELREDRAVCDGAVRRPQLARGDEGHQLEASPRHGFRELADE